MPGSLAFRWISSPLPWRLHLSDQVCCCFSVYCYSTPPHCDLDRFDGGFRGTVPGLQPHLNTRCACWSDLGQGPAGPFDIRIGGHDHAYRALVSPECMADWKSDFSHDLGGWLSVFSLPARIFFAKTWRTHIRIVPLGLRRALSGSVSRQLLPAPGDPTLLCPRILDPRYPCSRCSLVAARNG
jgi:hypothetical protein